MDLKSFQNREGLTQTDIAEQLDVTQATVSSWSMNRTTPTIPQLKKLIFMGLKLSEIFDDETEAFLMKGRRINKKRLSADVVETALSSVVNGDAGKITDKAACVQIVKLGLEELLGKKQK